MTVGGVTEPFARIVKRAGTRTFIEAVVVVGDAVFVVVVAVLDAVWVGVVDTVVVAGAVVDGEAGVVVLELDFDPPQPATRRTPKRTASVLTFAG